MDIFSEEEKSFRAIFYYFWTLETDDNEDNRQTTMQNIEPMQLCATGILTNP